MFTPFPISHRVFFAWIFSIPAAYLFVGFMGNYHPAFPSIFLLTLLAGLFSALYFYLLLGKAERYAARRWNFFLVLFLIITLIIFAGAMINALLRFPAMFDSRCIFLEPGQLLPFLFSALATLPTLVFAIRFLKGRNFQRTRIYQFLDRHALGILVSALFFFVYFIFSFTFNQPAFDTDDIFFDTDAWLWRTRFTTGNYQDIYWRVAHPFILIIFRPLIAFGASLLDGDRLAAAILLVAISGAACVFLAWYFVKHITGDSLYAALIASLLGGSAGHLVFGSLLETYIFLALISLAVTVLLLKDTPLYAFIIGGILSFGISLSALIAPSILFALKRRNLKQWLIYGIILAALTVPLTLLNNVIYPNSQPYFFNPSAYDTEGRNTFTPTLRRGTVVARVMLAYSFVAPDPLVFQREFDFFKVWMVDVSRKYYRNDPDRMNFSEYETTFGTTLAAAWIGLSALGVFGFLKNIKKQDNWFSYAFIFIILFEFIFHLKFGKELFLYAANWIFPIVLFLALGWRDWAAKKPFQLALILFIAAMLVNNARLLFIMLGASSFVIH